MSSSCVPVLSPKVHFPHTAPDTSLPLLVLPVVPVLDHDISSDLKWLLFIPRGGGGGGSSSGGGAGADADNDMDTGTSDTGSSDAGSNNHIVNEILSTPDDYYQVLGLEHRHCSTNDIQKAYRRRAVQTHPDKTGGDRKAFDIVAKAYEVLGSEETRAVYDRHGKSGLEHGTPSIPDFFQSMFFHSAKSPMSPKNRTVRYQLQVSLEDLYNGVIQEVSVATAASGRKHEKTVQVQVPRGAVGGQPIVLSGAMDFASAKGTPPGDLIFVVTPAPHPVFTRKNHDLAMEMSLSLEEALCGFRRNMTHLDGTMIEIESATTTTMSMAKKVPLAIATGDVQVLKGRGFPKSAQGDEYGDLYIQFRVETPKQTHPLSDEERQQLRYLLEKLQGKKTSLKKKRSSKTESTTKTRIKTTATTSGVDATTNTTTTKTKHKIAPSIDKEPESSESEESITLHCLVPGKVSDFGRATGISKIIHHDDHGHGQDYGPDDDDYDYLGQGGAGGGFPFAPFGSGTSTFFQQSQDGRRSRSFYFGNHPFFGENSDVGTENGAHSQCQQM